MKWLTNIPDPNDYAVAYWALAVPIDTPRAEAWEKHLAWLSDKHIGDPKEMPGHSVAQLKRMGYVGVYEDDAEGELCHT